MKDNALAKTYTHFSDQFKTLETAKSLLGFKQEEIEWQTCLITNQMKQ